MNSILKIFAGVFVAEGTLAVLGNVGMYHLRKKAIAQAKKRHPSGTTTLEDMKRQLAKMDGAG